MKRLEFSKRTKLQAWEKANGRCEQCTAKLMPGHYEFDHIHESTLGGDNGIGNCRVLCRSCHRAKTSQRAAVIAKSNRQRNKHIGIAPRSRNPLPGGRNSRFKIKLDGTVVPRQ